MVDERAGEATAPASLAARSRAWAMDEPVGATTLAGLFLYGSFRLNHFMFYGVFGVSPEEVGHGYVSTLAQSLIGGAFVFLVILVLMWLTSVVLVMVAEPTIAVFQKGWRFACRLLFLISSAALLLGWVLDQWVFESEFGLTAYGSTGALLWYVTSLCLEKLDPEWTLGRFFADVWSLLPFSAILAAVIFVGLMPMLARLDANAVLAGQDRPMQFAGPLNLPWGGDVAYAHWLGEAPVPGLEQDECLMYLGRSDGIAVLWHAETKELFRLPDSDLVLVSPHEGSCAQKTTMR